MPKRDDKKQFNIETFTIDSELTHASEIPGITRLLNRKKLKKLNSYNSNSKSPSDPKPTPQPPPPPPYPLAPEEPSTGALRPQAAPSIEMDTRDPAPTRETVAENVALPPPTGLLKGSESSTIRVRAARRHRAGESENSPLMVWEEESLKKSTDPLAKILIQLIEPGLEGALFLSIPPARSGSKTPVFHASALIGHTRKKNVWRGLRWNPSVAPAIWKSFLQTGVIELPPPGSHTVPTSARNIIRSAFGVDEEHWLTLMRIGTLHNCRGALAVITHESDLDRLCLLQRETEISPGGKAAA